jgi:hypothetical protein
MGGFISSVYDFIVAHAGIQGFKSFFIHFLLLTHAIFTLLGRTWTWFG